MRTARLATICCIVFADWRRGCCVISATCPGSHARRLFSADSLQVAKGGSQSPECWSHRWTARPVHPSAQVHARCVPAGDCPANVVRAEGVEPTRAVKPCGFSCRLRLSPPGRGAVERSGQVCGLDYPFTLPRKLRGLGAARLVSTPSRLESLRAWLGIAISGSPEFEQFCIAGFPASTQVFLKSAAYAIPPRPRAFRLQFSIIEQAGEIYTSVSASRRLDCFGVFGWLVSFSVLSPVMLSAAASSAS